MSIYDTITAEIVRAIDAGAGMFRLPWHRAGGGNIRPKNAATCNAYRGINVVALWAAAQLRGYDTATWATYKQWASLGAQVRRGERASTVVFYRELDAPADAGDDDATRFVARASFVFNAEQVDGYTVESPPVTTGGIAPDTRADAFIHATGARIAHGGSRAFYRPSTDEIVLPPADAFVGTSTSTATEAYYSTALHELGHWTGAESRLARNFGKRFGDAAYAVEELVAELTAAFLTADLGVSNAPRADHAQYLASWLAVLRTDSRAIFTAASAASRAADYLHSLQPSAAVAAA
jgi:antirestriction protein ArdC